MNARIAKIKRSSIVKAVILWSVILGGVLALLIPTIIAHGQTLDSSVVPDLVMQAQEGPKPVDPCEVFKNCVKGTETLQGTSATDGIVKLILTVVYAMIFIAGALSVLFIVWGAWQMITSAGDSGKYKTGLDTVRNAIIGLVLAVISVTIVYIIGNVILKVDIFSSDSSSAASTSTI
jgi:Type IV secretion system pilin